MGFPVNINSVDGDYRCDPSAGGVLPVGLTGDTLENLGQASTIRMPYLDLFKNGGSSDMRVNGSVTPVVFSIDATSLKVILVKRVVFIMISTQASTIAGEGAMFGGMGAAITNGLEFEASIGGVTYNIANSSTIPIKKIEDFVSAGFSQNMVANWQQTGTDYCAFTFDFSEPIQLWSGTSDKLIWRVNDNLPAINFTTLKAIAIGMQEVHT